MSKLTAATLATALADTSSDAGITIRTEAEPLSGPHDPIKPAGYPGAKFQVEKRWHGDPLEAVDAIIVDNVASQANRLEAALRAMRAELGLPEIILDLSSISTLPPHLPTAISSFSMPHRHADAYLRDALLDGEKFMRTKTGATIFNASVDNPAGLLQWFPQALIFGFWTSHAGKKRSQAKLSRAWVSEITGYDPAGDSGNPTRTLGVKGDPLNLSVVEQAEFDENDHVGFEWHLTEGSTKDKAAGGKSRKALSEIGHGQVPFSGDEAALRPVSFRDIEQRATVSFAALRRLSVDGPESSATMRALLVALGLVAHVEAFGRAFHLRSDCDLRAATTTWTWLGGSGEEDQTMESLSRDRAIALFGECLEAAAAAGILEGGGWRTEPLVVTPNKALTDAISKTWPLEPVSA